MDCTSLSGKGAFFVTKFMTKWAFPDLNASAQPLGGWNLSFARVPLVVVVVALVTCVVAIRPSVDSDELEPGGELRRSSC